MRLAIRKPSVLFRHLQKVFDMPFVSQLKMFVSFYSPSLLNLFCINHTLKNTRLYYGFEFKKLQYSDYQDKLYAVADPEIFE